MNDHNRQFEHDYNDVWSKYREQDSIVDYISQRRIDRRVYYDLIQNYVNSFANPLILELGCGTGIDICTVAEGNPQTRAFGSDISEKSIQLGVRVAKELSSKISYFVADTLNIPFDDNQIDIVFSQGLVEHFEDPCLVIREQTRVLKRGGILIINVPQILTAYTLIKHKLMRLGEWELGWETEFSYRGLKKIGRELRLLEREVCGYQYWKSWWEPTFILRDFYDKLYRRNPWRELQPFLSIKRSYDTFWKLLEKKWGHYFLQNIVIVFEKV